MTWQEAAEIFYSRMLKAEEELDVARERYQNERSRVISLEVELTAKRRECEAANRRAKEAQEECEIVTMFPLYVIIM